MADFIFNIAKGRLNEYVRRVDQNDPSGAVLRIRLYKVFSGTEDTYRDCDSLGAVEAVSTTTIADFTNYADKTLTDADISGPTIDDANNKQYTDIDDLTWADAGGTTDNTLAKCVAYYDSTGSDGNACIPLAAWDFVKTTNGSDLQAVVHADGLWSAS